MENVPVMELQPCLESCSMCGLGGSPVGFQYKNSECEKREGKTEEV